MDKFCTLLKRISISVLIWGMALSAAYADAPLKLNLGDIPPDYLGKDRAGNQVNLANEKGKVVVITFWASWCAPCRAELPVLDRIQQQVSQDSFRVVAINFKEDRKRFRKVKKLLKDYVLTITHDKRGRIGKKFGVNGIPHLLVIDKKGAIVYQAVGYGEESLDKTIVAINKALRAG